MTDPDVVQSHCNGCLRLTRHDVLYRCHDDETEEHDGQAYLISKETYELVRCRGCENVSFRLASEFSGDPNEHVMYFPPAISRRLPEYFRELKWFWTPPYSDIYALFGEIYSSLHSGNRRLALMGTRAVLDLAITHKLNDIGSFERKLDEAKRIGWITDIEYKTLEVAIDAGNAASHRAYCPTTEQLGRVLDIVEHFIERCYVLEESAGEIVKETPVRAKKKQ